MLGREHLRRTAGQAPDAPAVGGRAATRLRIPPGQHRVGGLPLLDLGIRPEIKPEDWRLTVDGAVDNPLSWDFATLLAEPQSEIVADIHCVTTWTSLDNRFAGVSCRRLLELVQPKPAAAFVMAESADGYFTNLPLTALQEEDSLIAHSWNGEPLTVEHGGPEPR